MSSFFFNTDFFLRYYDDDNYYYSCYSCVLASVPEHLQGSVDLGSFSHSTEDFPPSNAISLDLFPCYSENHNI